MENYCYPAILKYSSDCIYVSFPDFPECFTDGENEEDALINAKEVLELWLFNLESQQIKFPPKTPIKEILLCKNETIILISISMPLVRDKVKNILVKKTLTLPKWLDELGKENKVNFSALLQKSLIEYLGVGKNI